jgi:hypothetical protein
MEGSFYHAGPIFRSGLAASISLGKCFLEASRNTRPRAQFGGSLASACSDSYKGRAVKSAPPESPKAADPELASDGGEEAAVQHATHEPLRRVNVQEESRTIVVADDQATGAIERETRKLEPYTASRAEKTVVIRDRRAIEEIRKVGKKSSVSSLLLWIAAGLAAFGLGGALAVLTAKRDAPPKAETVAARPIAAKPAPPTPPQQTPPMAAATADSVEGPALNAAELPVEKEPKAAPSASTPVKKPAAARPPASSTASSPKLPATPQAKQEIPSGI